VDIMGAFDSPYATQASAINPVQQVQFDNGVTWNLNTFMSQAVLGV
jgi:hypothetical protein